MKRLLILIGLLMAFLVGQTQTKKHENDEKVNSLYRNAVLLLEGNKLFEANTEFEKVIQLNPNHKDALYYLAIISARLDDSPSAIRFLLKGVKLNDKRSAKLLVDKFKYELSYADTMQNVEISVQDKYQEIEQLQVSSLSDLTSKILSKTTVKKEQLQILLLWVNDHMKPDSIRFFNGGNPLSTSDAFTSRIGLCDEYSNIVSEFCKAINVPNYKVVGYVKYANFKPNDTFTEANHAWNAVYLDSSWVLCDLFWSTVALLIDKKSEPQLIKRLETNYFLGRPDDFINDHLPADPVFQFSNYPIVLGSFAKKLDGIDREIPKMKYYNYSDSLNLFSKMTESDRMLKIAQHSYQYNKDNPNSLIVESYNFAADILNKKTPTRPELIKAKKYLTSALTVIDASKNEEVKALKENCKSGIMVIDKRLVNK